MAMIWCESGTDATQDLSFYSSTGGTVASATDQPGSGWTGPRTIKFSTSNPAVTAFVRRSGVLADAGRRVSARFAFDVAPGSSAAAVLALQTSGNTTVAAVDLSTSRILQLRAAGISTVTGSTALSTNTPYRVALCYTITSATSFRFDVYLNGVLEVSVDSTGTLTNTGSNVLFTGATAAWGTGRNVWFDDIYVDDGTDYSDPGDIRVTAKRPFSDGTAVEFTTQIGSGNSGYGSGHADEVNERPTLSNGWSISTTTRKTEEYSIEGLAVGDIDLTNQVIVDQMGWIYASVDSTANSPVHRLILGGVATAKTITTTASIHTQVAGSSVYPAGSTDIGMDAQYTTTPHLTLLFECGILLAYKAKVPLTFVGPFDHEAKLDALFDSAGFA